MKSGRLFLSAIAAFSVMMLLSYVWYILLMKDFYDNVPVAATADELNAVIRPEPLAEFVVIGYAILALLMAYIYPKGIEGENKIANGLKFGALIGILWTLPTGLMWHAYAELQSLTMITADVLFHIAEEGISGVVIALIYGIPART